MSNHAAPSTQRRLTVRECRLIANTGEIHNIEKVSTERVRRILKVLIAADWRREGIQEAEVIARDELAFRVKHGL